jgi:hypothetical protein
LPANGAKRDQTCTGISENGGNVNLPSFFLFSSPTSFSETKQVAEEFTKERNKKCREEEDSIAAKSDEGLLVEEEVEYLEENWLVTASQQPRALIETVNKWAHEQVVFCFF